MITSRFPNTHRRRLGRAAAALGALLVMAVCERASDERTERVRIEFVHEFVESVRTGSAFYETYIIPEHRSNILESRPLMSEHYRLTRAGSSAGQYDYNLEFDNGACGQVSVWEGRERRAYLYVWIPKGGCGIAHPSGEARPSARAGSERK